MLSVRLIKLIETHAESLTHEVVADLLTNEHTPSYLRIPREELEQRAFAFYQNLGNWIGNPKDDAIRAEYEEWGRIRCRQGIPVSEIVYSLILRKNILVGTSVNMGLSNSQVTGLPPANRFPSNSTTSKNSITWLRISSTGLCTTLCGDMRCKPKPSRAPWQSSRVNDCS